MGQAALASSPKASDSSRRPLIATYPVMLDAWVFEPVWDLVNGRAGRTQDGLTRVEWSPFLRSVWARRSDRGVGHPSAPPVCGGQGPFP